MDTAKVFQSGNSQAVRLPKEFQLSASEVYIKRIGDALILLPKDDPWTSLERSLGLFSEDFMRSREQPAFDQREKL
jgi:antitoxin VapB